MTPARGPVSADGAVRCCSLRRKRSNSAPRPTCVSRGRSKCRTPSISASITTLQSTGWPWPPKLTAKRIVRLTLREVAAQPLGFFKRSSAGAPSCRSLLRCEASFAGFIITHIVQERAHLSSALTPMKLVATLSPSFEGTTNPRHRH
jgi:hypothetical protein